MRHEVITLSKYFPQLNTAATLTVYVQENSPEIAPNRLRPAVIVCPGGGYAFLSDREAEPVALAFLARGYQVFVLRYSLSPVHYPAQLMEAACAVACVRQNAEQWHVDAGAISVCGFSAGGHLACSLGALWNDTELNASLGFAPERCRPNALILAYPVITGGEFAHRGSFDNLLGNSAQSSLTAKLSLENAVGAHTPPVFLWHTLADDGVPVENSLLLAAALRKAGVPFELHIFPKGPHGLALANQETKSFCYDRINPHVAQWFDLCDHWLKTMFTISDDYTN